jgi:CRISPR-associated endonuclease/helicase Cas3
MRVLVEQTADVVGQSIDRLGLLWNGSGDHSDKVGVHVLMGGADPGGDWDRFPEECAVLIGTQDMLLSRALNRGYASGRARWPLEFGLLSHDALWVMDEVQLMDVGLATSAQLQAFHDEDSTKGFRPRHTWWKSVDTEARYNDWVRDPLTIPADQRMRGLGSVHKSLSLTTIEADDAKALAKTVLNQHLELGDGDHGRVTLVVCNTVDRACATADVLRALAPGQPIELVHSRFRPAERAAWRNKFLSREACTKGAARIIVATQVVEAGVDISAGCVVTDLAPWPSLVQRFGRCARYGGSGCVVVVDRGRKESDALPYGVEELGAAWAALEKIRGRDDNVGTAGLDAFEDGLDESDRKTLYPYEPRHLLLRRELDELFDTTPDLTGADLDISRFIRSGDERDLQVFWLDVPKPRKGAPRPEPPRQRRPLRDELCAVGFLDARNWLCGSETKTNRKPKLRPHKRAWVWDWLDGEWVVAERSMLTPGRIVCVAADSGGYRVERGFDPNADDGVPVLAAMPSMVNSEVCSCLPQPMGREAELQADDSQDGEDLSASAWKTIACHAGEVVSAAELIASKIELKPELHGVLVLAARWHDLGKSHSAFQGAIRLPITASLTCPRCGKAHSTRLPDRPDRQDLAKAPKAPWPRRPKTYRTIDDRDVRPGLRHELASALALFSVLRRYQPRHAALLGPWIEALDLIGGTVPDAPVDLAPTPCEQAVLACSCDEFDLLAYLVASHHGKVRVALHAAQRDQTTGITATAEACPFAVCARAMSCPRLCSTRWRRQFQR